MDPDINIMKRQMVEETQEKYFLLNRIKELNEEIAELKERIERMENPSTISGDEKTW